RRCCARFSVHSCAYSTRRDPLPRDPSCGSNNGRSRWLIHFPGARDERDTPRALPGDRGSIMLGNLLIASIRSRATSSFTTAPADGGSACLPPFERRVQKK